jgi:hypothetical protein
MVCAAPLAVGVFGESDVMRGALGLLGVFGEFGLLGELGLSSLEHAVVNPSARTSALASRAFRESCIASPCRSSGDS